MLTSFMVALLLTADIEPGTPREEGRCSAQTFQLEISDYLRFGDVFDRARNHCATVNIPDAPNVPGRLYVIGRTPLTRFRLFGEEFGLNLNVISQPQNRVVSRNGFFAEEFGANLGSNGNDLLYVAPSLDLPDSWDRAIDQAAAPIAIAGGIAITTAVLVGILGK